jgi:hypothetical protein
MPKKATPIDDSTPIEVKLSADNKGIASLGIRINGTAWRVLATSLTLPSPGSTKSWKKTIGELNK